MHRFILSVFLLISPALAAAQETAPDSIFARARQLVSEGQGAAGRSLVDSLLAAAAPGSPAYAEALFWRASLAASVDDAERDYRRLAVEFPLSSRSEDALIRLAQLELTRGNRPLAIKHLERLLLDHPQSATRARASYWMARVHLEDGNLPRACAALATARSTAAPTDVELRNQLQYHEQRCVGVDTSAAVVAAGTGPPRGAAPAGSPSTPPRTTVPNAAAAAAPPAAPVTAAREFTVQVSALDSREAAEALSAQLRARGHDARVFGAARPFRVRVGRYATREEADAAAGRMQAQGIATWVTEAESR